MASIFKQQYTTKDPKTGKRVKKKSAYWYIDYKATGGTRKRVKGFKDKAATTQLAAKLEKEAELADSGLGDNYKEHRKKPLSQHLSDFRASLTNKGTTEKQAQQVYNRAAAILKGCGFVYMADIQASRIQRFLAERRKGGLGIRSSNFYLQAIKQFCRWLVADRRAADNPIEYLKGQTVVDQRKRRALTLDEICRLLDATAKGSKHHSLTAEARYMLYLLALSTGFRASELASLTWQSLDLDTAEPTITVKAGYTKNRKEATMPLRQDVAVLFRQWQTDSGCKPTDKAFAGFNPKKGAAMLRQDLGTADIDYQDEAERVADFHSFRHTFITNVVKSGATVKESQVLARHSKPELTLGVYTHLGISDERRALDKMPILTSPATKSNQAAALKTGTDDLPVDAVGGAYKPAYKKLAKNAYLDSASMSANGTRAEGNRKSDEDSKSLSGGLLGSKEVQLALPVRGQKKQAAMGFEPMNNGFANRRLSPLGHAAVIAFGNE